MEHLDIIEGTKEEKYRALMPQLAAVVADEPDLIANMANIASMLHETFGFWWTGFYRVAPAVGATLQRAMRNGEPMDELVLGPFQGPMACVRIRRGRGVCGTAWAEGRTIIVPDVDAFPGHIACSSASRSEIVVPLLRDGEVVAVLDIDSEHLNTFDETDKNFLEQVAEMLAR